MSILFALLAALANAVNVATQHVASTSDPRSSKGWQLVLYLLRSPLWLVGWAALLGAFVFQAIALHSGLVSVVQPLLITELVFSLALRRLWIRQSISVAAWASAALTCVAVAVFVVVAEPRGGASTPTTGAWASSILACAGVATLLALLGLRGSPSRRAALLATASATVWALEATFIKAMTDTLTQYGMAGTFARWPVYAVIVGGITGTLLQQAALHLGPLRVSQPLLVIVDPVISIALSVHLFAERFTQSSLDLVTAAVAFATMCAGVVLLTRTVPESLERQGAGGAP
jgi:drug/metabolite transporter (DMT)-like permease